MLRISSFRSKVVFVLETENLTLIFSFGEGKSHFQISPEANYHPCAVKIVNFVFLYRSLPSFR